MPHEIRVPRLGWSMERETFVGWLKQPGDEVAVGEPLFELEGEKALQEVDAIDAGRLHVAPDAPQPGSVVCVGALLGYLLAPGETAPVVSSPPEIAPAAEMPVTTIEPGPAPARSGRTDGQPLASPRAKRIAAELGVDWTVLVGTGRDGRIREADVRDAALDAIASWQVSR